jgi:hypothetical protein
MVHALGLRLTPQLHDRGGEYSALRVSEVEPRIDDLSCPIVCYPSILDQILKGRPTEHITGG